MAKITLQTKATKARIGLHLVGVLVWFDRLWVAGVGPVYQAEAEDPDVIERARSMGYTISMSPPPDPGADSGPLAGLLASAAPAGPATQSDRARSLELADEAVALEYPAPIAGALRNGWTYGDLEGLGADPVSPDWGEGGGHSASTTLTVAQMNLCLAPPGWAALRETRWPWELDFVPPIGWTQPSVGSKGVPTVCDPVLDSDDIDPNGLVIDCATGAPVVPPADGSLIEGYPVEDDPAAPRLEPLELIIEGEPVSHWLDSYGTDDQFQRAVELFRALAAEADDHAPPSAGKARYHLKKNGLPPASKPEFAALLTLI